LTPLLLRRTLEAMQSGFANDIDQDKWQMYREHFGDTGEFVVADVHHLDAASVPSVTPCF
jgi:hypothetical protein